VTSSAEKGQLEEVPPAVLPGSGLTSEQTELQEARKRKATLPLPIGLIAGGVGVCLTIRTDWAFVALLVFPITGAALSLFLLRRLA